MKEVLHQEVQALRFSSALPAIALHALIEAGAVTKIECHAEVCKYDTRKFVPCGEDRRLVLSFDHIKRILFNGSHRPENIRLLHLGCNSGFKRSQIDIERRKRGSIP